MTPLDSGSPTRARPAKPRHRLRIGHQRSIGPACLPLLAADGWDLLAPAGLSLSVDEMPDMGEGFARVADGRLDALVAGPLTLLAPEAAACRPLGALLTAPGGVLIRGERLAALCQGDTVTIATPIGLPAADALCRRLLQGWAARQGRAVAAQTIHIAPIAATSEPLAPLAAGFDGLWPALACHEAAIAAAEGLAVRLVTAEAGGLPAFAAVDLVAHRHPAAEDSERLEALIAVLAEAVRRLAANPETAAGLWQQHAGGSAAAAAAVVRAALPCLNGPLDRQPTHWPVLTDLT
jgi:hypothetical protein